MRWDLILVIGGFGVFVVVGVILFIGLLAWGR